MKLAIKNVIIQQKLKADNPRQENRNGKLKIWQDSVANKTKESCRKTLKRA